MSSVKIGMIGLGTVGCGVARLLEKEKRSIALRVGRDVELVRVAVRDLGKARDVSLAPSILTDDPYAVVREPQVDIVIEVMGGENPAFDLAVKSAENRKHFVTANKHLLALRGEEIRRAFKIAGVELGFEAAVAGAVPVIRTIRSALAGDRIELVQGVVNGTANYILSRMAEDKEPFDKVLEDAKALGYAEADPAFDVDGTDSAHKIAILASLAFGTPVDFNDVSIEGIREITPEDIEMAGEFGYVIKLLAMARRNADSIEVRALVAMIPAGRMIAKVNGALNAVEMVCRHAGDIMLVGPGAGAGPTASAIAGDLVDIARKIAHGNMSASADVEPDESETSGSADVKKIPVRPVAQSSSEYYLRFTVPDRPGVLAMISGALGREGISISSMIQRGRKENKPVSVVLMTHTALEADLAKALSRIEAMNVCAEPTITIRIVNDEKK